MYSGTMIENLIKTVQRAEDTARQQRVQMVRKPAPVWGSQAFFYQMQSMTQVHVVRA